jgi:hypothetical protein
LVRRHYLIWEEPLIRTVGICPPAKGGSAMHRNDGDPYAEFENALTDLMTERDGFLTRRLKLAAARARVDKANPRYLEAIEVAFAVLDSPDLLSL